MLALIRLLGPRTAAGIAPLIALALAHSAAAGHIAIRRVDTSRYPLIRVTVVSPVVSAKPPRLFENGRPVVDVQAANFGREQSIVLALDHSQSMYNKPLADAKDAAQRFVEAKPQSNQISVIAFASQALSLSRFSTSTTDVDDTLGSISTDPAYGTALYDAVVLASRELRAHGLPGRVMILVTDGQETTSKATLAQGSQPRARRALRSTRWQYRVAPSRRARCDALPGTPADATTRHRRLRRFEGSTRRSPPN
jgi:VWA domain-containing protein